jgi:aspartate aminotransferase
MIAPAGGFYSTPNAGNNQVRIAYVLNENDLKDSIEILKIGLIEYSK